MVAQLIQRAELVPVLVVALWPMRTQFRLPTGSTTTLLSGLAVRLAVLAETLHLACLVGQRWFLPRAEAEKQTMPLLERVARLQAA